MRHRLSRALTQDRAAPDGARDRFFTFLFWNGAACGIIRRGKAWNPQMVEIVKEISSVVATASEFAAVVVIVIGAVQAIASPVAGWLRTKTPATPLVVFRGFAGWLVLALEFLLAADILKTAISPTWNDIGQLAAIAAIRTFLNYSLGHDLRHTP